MNCSNILGASGALPLRLSRSAPPRISMYLAIAVLLCLLSGRRSAGDRARHLSGGDVEAVPDVDAGDGEYQGPERLLVVVPGDFVPDLVRHRVRPVAEPGGSLGERQCGAFFVREVGRLAPGRHGEEPLVCFACLLGVASMHVDA